MRRNGEEERWGGTVVPVRQDQERGGVPAGVDQTALGVLLALSFLPPLLFVFWVRMHEKHDREPVMAVLGMFLYGGTLGVIIALALSLLLDAGFGSQAQGFTLLSLVVIAPLVEELAKGLGLVLIHRRITEPEDGIIYGAAIGLGFGATENLLYGLSALSEGTLVDATVTITFRVFSSVLLHAGSTALLGYGYARMRLARRGLLTLLPFYLLAVVQHSLYNFLVGPRYIWGFAAAVVMVIIVTSLLRQQIRRLDRGPPADTRPWPPF